jgi:hypothetical protein
MRVAELIEELQKLPPGAAVRVHVRRVYLSDPWEPRGQLFNVSEEQSSDVDDVRQLGPYVLIEAQ